MVVHLHDERSSYLQTPNELNNAMISKPAKIPSWVFSPIVKAAQFAAQREILCYMQNAISLLSCKEFLNSFCASYGQTNVSIPRHLNLRLVTIVCSFVDIQ
jgi:hypothetical protein